MVNRCATAVVFVLAVATTAWAQGHLTDVRHSSPSYVASVHPAVLRALCLGHAQTMADVVYLQAVAVWGQRSAAGDRYADLEPLLQRVLALDDHHEAAYLLAGTALTMQGMQQDAGLELLRRGAVLFPNNWRLLFLYGFNAFDLQHDTAAAAQALTHAALVPGSPPHLPMLAASMSEKSNAPAAAIVMLETLAQEAPDANDALKYRARAAILAARAQALGDHAQP